MKYKKTIFSSTLIVLLSSGCVKPTNEVSNPQQNGTNSQNQGQVYNEQPTEVIYEDSQQPIYSDPTVTTNSGDGGVYNTQTTTPNDTSNVYQQTQPSQPSSNNNIYGGSSDIYNQSQGVGGYGNPNSSGAGVYGTQPSSSQTGAYSGGGNNYGGYSDPYASPTNSGGGYTPPIDDPYSSTSSSNNRYSTNTPYGSSSSSSSYNNAKGIKLQVAAFKDYAAAEEFKSNISLPPQYTAYIQRGSINKVIVAGIPTRAKAKELANRQFPGAFVIGGTPLSYSSSSSTTSSNSSYGNSSSNSVANIKSGIGIQIGAFSSKAKARSIAQERAKGKYTAVVKTANVGGKTIYKAILLGFKSREDAKRVIESGEVGNGFVVSGIYP